MKIKKCIFCNKKMKVLSNFIIKKFCSEECRKKYRKKINTNFHHYGVIKTFKCCICGFNLTTDIHRERINNKSYFYELCPNHHALISRRITNLFKLLNKNYILDLTGKDYIKDYKFNILKGGDLSGKNR